MSVLLDANRTASTRETHSQAIQFDSVYYTSLSCGGTLPDELLLRTPYFDVIVHELDDPRQCRIVGQATVTDEASGPAARPCHTLDGAKHDDTTPKKKFTLRFECSVPVAMTLAHIHNAFWAETSDTIHSGQR